MVYVEAHMFKFLFGGLKLMTFLHEVAHMLLFKFLFGGLKLLQELFEDICQL